MNVSSQLVSRLFSIILNNFHTTLKQGQAARPWQIPDPKPRADIGSSVFGHHFLTVVIDEAHNMQDPGNKHIAILRVIQQTSIKLIMTAIPLHTAAKVSPLKQSH